MVLSTLVGLAGGLGVFIYGLSVMSQGLQSAVGDRMRRVLEFLTRTPPLSALTGAMVTTAVQSSTTTTVMVVGFVNAGLMSLKQAVGVIMGANIGTTITAQLVAFRLTEMALPAVALGVGLYFYAPRKLTRYVGQGLLGFGLLFLGLNIMSDTVRPLAELPFFMETLASFGQYPLLGILAGAAFTALVQSSSATTGLVIVLAGDGLIDLTGAIALVLGSNLGTTVTALMAGFSASLTARRTAMAHFLFNAAGIIVFLPFLGLLTQAVAMTAGTLEREVAHAHTIFNVVNTLVMLPLINYFVRAVEILVPGQETVFERGLKFIDPKALLRTPVSLALEQVTREVARMGRIAQAALQDVWEGLANQDEKSLNQFPHKEQVLDELETEITVFLAQLSQQPMTEDESRRITSLLHAVNDIERVGDHGENLMELAQIAIDQSLPFSDSAQEELSTMFTFVMESFGKACRSLADGDETRAREVLTQERGIDRMEANYRNNHIKRLNEGVCFPQSGIVFLDIISNLERIGDHANNIAHAVIGELS